MYSIINFHSAEIDWVANAANIEESQRARQLEEEIRYGKKAHTVCSFFAFDHLPDSVRSLQPPHDLSFAEYKILFSPNA